MLANGFRTGSLVSATSWRLFQVEKPVAERIALSRHLVIVLAGSRQVRYVSDMLARWTLKNDRTYDPVRHLFDAVFTYFVLWHCVYVIDYVIFPCYKFYYSSKVAMFIPRYWTHLVPSSVANSDKRSLYAPRDSLMYGLTHVEFFRFLRSFKMVTAPRPAATSRLEQAAMTLSSLATSAMFAYTTHLSKYRSGYTAQVRSMGFMPLI